MSETINQFLDWAELENSQLQRDLHALRMAVVVKSVATRMDKISPGRIRLQPNNDFTVIANPIHVDQLITNLLSNALKFSPESEKVEVKLENNQLKVRDRGRGIPAPVRERLGEPFNVGTYEGSDATGTGLGLAWIATVVKLYDWKLDIQSGDQGTEISVKFPKQED